MGVHLEEEALEEEEGDSKMNKTKFFKFIEENQSFGLGWLLGNGLVLIIQGLVIYGILSMIIASLLIFNQLNNITNKCKEVKNAKKRK